MAGVLRMDTGQMNTEHEKDTGQKMNTRLSTEEKAKQITKTVITKETQKTAQRAAQKTAPNGMPVYDINEPWVQQYIADFGCEPSFF